MSKIDESKEAAFYAFCLIISIAIGILILPIALSFIYYSLGGGFLLYLNTRVEKADLQFFCTTACGFVI